MTQSIDAETRARSVTPPGSEPVTPPGASTITVSRNHLLFGVRCFVGVMTLKAIGFLIAAFTFAGWRSALAAATFFILAVLGGVVLAVDALLANRINALNEQIADRKEFYQRGQLDGWMRGWRGQEPEVDDPLLR